MSQCKHETRWRTYLSPCPSDDAYHERCLRCGEQLPLGPSSETDERVAVEIRAAEIAAGLVKHSKSHWQLTNCSHREWVGWAAHAGMPQFQDTTLSLRQLAGYLARCIATHDARCILEHSEGG